MTTKEQVEEQWLRTIIIPKIINGKLISTYDKDVEFKVHSIEIKFIGTDEAFMLTTCYKAKLDYEYKNKRETRTLVVKKTPEIPEEFFNSINFPALFTNEIEGYRAIMPTISNFSRTKINVPKFYYGDLQKTSAIIILEDFNAYGFRMAKDRTNLNLEHILLAVKYLATFHGVCFALKQTDRKLFDTIISNLKESRYATEELHPDWSVTLRTSIQRMRTSAERYYPEISEAFLSKFVNLISNSYRYGKQRVHPVEPLATLCHGDYLRNNVAYKYEEDSERPIDVMMFDLQTMRYSSPMIDLSVCLAVSTFAEVRNTHFDEIFDTYCKQLALTYVEHTQQELPDFLSHKTLLKEYIQFLPYSAGIAASFVMTLYDPPTTSIQERLSMVQTPEEIEQDVRERGGETIDRELAHQVKEMYDLSLKYNVDICEGFEF